MAEEEGSKAGADTNMPADVADKMRKKLPARLGHRHPEEAHQQHGGRQELK